MSTTAARALVWTAAAAGIVVLSLLLRGETLSVWSPLNPDEAELMAMARAASRSPAPFTTWTMGTTGPVWPWFLAALGALGVPLTIASAHLLAALFVAVMGLFVITLLRRGIGTLPGTLVGILWWLALVLVYPVGGLTDFGAMATELLPATLVLGAALVPIHLLRKHPWLFFVVGALCSLAIAAKYQALPVAAALVLVRLIGIGAGLRQILRLGLIAAAGALVPVAAVALSMLLSPDFSLPLLQQSLQFLGSYAGNLAPLDRFVATTRMLVTQPLFIAAIVLVVLLALRSTRRVNLGRAIMVVASVAGAYAGGMAFGHYLILVYAGLAIAAALPLRDGAVLLPSRPLRVAAVGLTAAAAAAGLVIGLALGRVSLATPAAIAMAASPQAVIVDPDLAKLCPPGSAALVWGWAPELYVYYSWENAAPVLNSLGLVSSPTALAAGESMIRDAVGASDCVVDAVGAPFFGFGPESGILSAYPSLAAELERRFGTEPGILDCTACRVYVAD